MIISKLLGSCSPTPSHPGCYGPDHTAIFNFQLNQQYDIHLTSHPLPPPPPPPCTHKLKTELAYCEGGYGVATYDVVVIVM
jgi:hypothetical protein